MLWIGDTADDTKLPGEALQAALSSSITSSTGGDATAGTDVGRDAVDLVVTSMPTPMPSPTADTGRGGLSVPEAGWEARSAAEVVGGAVADLDADAAAARTPLSKTVVKIDVASARRPFNFMFEAG